MNFRKITNFSEIFSYQNNYFYINFIVPDNTEIFSQSLSKCYFNSL